MERLVDQLPERLISREIELANTGFVGSGPIASAPPAANYWGNGKIGPLYYNTTDGKKYVSVRAFHNEGTDYGDWGRPSWISKLIPGQGAARIKIATCCASLSSAGAFVGFSNVSNTNRNLMARLNSVAGDGKATLTHGGTTASVSANQVYFLNKKQLSEVVLTPSLASIYVDETLATSIAPTLSGDCGGNFVIGALFQGSFLNIDLDTFFVEVLDLNSLPIAKFNANSPDQWDGGATATDSAGNPITFTDGTPTGRVAYSWIPLADAIAWGVFS